MHKSKRFNKKEAVRFLLVPGRDEQGNPTTTFKPMETRSRLSRKEREKIINQISGYQIEIDGKPVDESEIPSYVLEQIKGRADLIFNQKNPDLLAPHEPDDDFMQEDLEDRVDWDEEGEPIPEEEYMGFSEKEEEYESKEAEGEKEVDLDGQKYKLTNTQLKLLEEVLPANYENYEIEGVQFVKYDEDGNRIDEKESYQKYIADPVERRGIIDSYLYVPEKPVNTVDNDLEGEVLKGDLKEVEDALNYEGQQEAYEEMEDDFFSKLMGDQGPSKPKEPKFSSEANGFKKKKEQMQPQIIKKQDSKRRDDDQQIEHEIREKQSDSDQDYDEEDYDDEQEQITDEMLDKALKQFEGHQEKGKDQELIPGTGVPVDMKGMPLIDFIQTREGCLGKDGELDWRTLTKREKKEYMKNKKIREVYEEVREREIKEKLKGKKNVNAQQLHLKQYIDHIPYKEDHVMQEAIERDLQVVVNLDEVQGQQEFQTESDEDDIVSYRAKTSIISSNLATVEETRQKEKKKAEESNVSEVKNIEKVKVIPERRNRKETSEERKERKEKLRQMKKLKKQQRKEFKEVFEAERKKVMKRDNSSNNPLNRVGYVKIV